MVEAPLDLQASMKVPENHYDICRAADVPYRGNAAGNTLNVVDLKGQNESVAPLPAGFTARGIVALVFSCISAILGMAAIAWYVSHKALKTTSRQPRSRPFGILLTKFVAGTELLPSDQLNLLRRRISWPRLKTRHELGVAQTMAQHVFDPTKRQF